jgi:hypothetical protein
MHRSPKIVFQVVLTYNRFPLVKVEPEALWSSFDLQIDEAVD